MDYFDSRANIYPFAGVTYHTCDIIFIGKYDGQQLHPSDDVAAVEWHHRNHIPLDRIAFPSARAALRKFSGVAE
jgi:hypothetical protein